MQKPFQVVDRVQRHAGNEPIFIKFRVGRPINVQPKAHRVGPGIRHVVQRVQQHGPQLVRRVVERGAGKGQEADVAQVVAQQEAGGRGGRAAGGGQLGGVVQTLSGGGRGGQGQEEAGDDGLCCVFWGGVGRATRTWRKTARCLAAQPSFRPLFHRHSSRPNTRRPPGQESLGEAPYSARRALQSKRARARAGFFFAPLFRRRGRDFGPRRPLRHRARAFADGVEGGVTARRTGGEGGAGEASHSDFFASLFSLTFILGPQHRRADAAVHSKRALPEGGRG